MNNEEMLGQGGVSQTGNVQEQQGHPKLGKIAIGIAVLAIIGFGAWYVFASGRIGSKQITATHVAERMSKVKSFHYEGSFQMIAGASSPAAPSSFQRSLQGLVDSVAQVQPGQRSSDIDFKIALKGSIDAKDINNTKSSANIDITIDAAELSGKPIQIGLETRSIGQASYLRLKNMKGLESMMPVQINPNTWIRVSLKDIEQMYSSMGIPVPTPSAKNEEIKKIAEQYKGQFREIAKKHNLVDIQSVSNSENIDGEATETVAFKLNEDATVAFAKEAIPLYLSLVNDVLKQMPQYKELVSGEQMYTLADSDYQAIETGLRDFFKYADSTFTATVGNRSMLLYNFNTDTKITDPQTKEYATITGNIALRDFDKSVTLEVPAGAVPLLEFIQTLYSQSYGQMTN